MSEDETFALMSAVIKNYKVARFNLKKLMNILKTFETLFGKKTKVDVALGNDSPIIIGRYNEKKETMIGIALAPILVEGDDK